MDPLWCKVCEEWREPIFPIFGYPYCPVCEETLEEEPELEPPDYKEINMSKFGLDEEADNESDDDPGESDGPDLEQADDAADGEGEGGEAGI